MQSTTKKLALLKILISKFIRGEIKIENEQSYDVWNRDNTTILYLSGLHRRKQSDYQADTVENMNWKKSLEEPTSVV